MTIMGQPQQVARFVVEGDPKAQPRARSFARKLKDGRVVARVYDAGTAEAWKTQVAAAAKPHRPATPLTGPVSLQIEFRMKRPKSHYGTGRNANRLKPSAPVFHISKPDRNNLVKAVEDAMTQLGFWRDDAQVAAGETTKIYTLEGERPGVTIRVLTLSEEG